MPHLPRLIFGYHGCSATLAQRVVCKKAELRYSQNDYDWLGDGIYFWEDSPQRALQWAEQCVKRRLYKTPAVIGAIINPGYCLNLIEPEYLELVHEAYIQYEQYMEILGRIMPRNTGPEFRARKLDCAVFRFLHEMRVFEDKKAFETIRAFFTEGTELYPNAGLRERDHIQICVRDPKQIVGYFLPRDI